MQPRSSVEGSRFPVALGPPIVQALGECAGLDEAQRRRLWDALVQARWSVASQWRQLLEAFHPADGDVEALLRGPCAPTAMVYVLEQLVAERVLARPAATRIEEMLLRRTDAHGQWCGTPRGRNDAP
jgi:hypothetical protein